MRQQATPVQTLMETTSTFQLPMNTILHATPQHERRDTNEQPSLTRSSSRLIEKKYHKTGIVSPDRTTPGAYISHTDRSELQKDLHIQHHTFTPHEGIKVYNQNSSRILGSSMGRAKRPTRPRGESDLGRPAPITRTPIANGFGVSPISEDPPALELSSARPHSSFDELLTGVLLPLPFLFASLAYPAHISIRVEPVQGSSKTYREETLDVPLPTLPTESPYAPLIQACSLSAAALLLFGILARIQTSQQTLDRRKGAAPPVVAGSLFRTENISRIILKILSVGLPYYATMQLGGISTSLILLLAVSSGLTSWAVSRHGSEPLGQVVAVVGARKLSCAVMSLCCLFDFSGWAPRTSFTGKALGYLALASSALVVQPPMSALVDLDVGFSKESSTYSVASSPATYRIGSAFKSPLTSSTEEANLTLVAGTSLATIAMVLSLLLSIAPDLSYTAISFSTLSLASVAGLLFLAQPLRLQSSSKIGVAAGSVLIAIFGSLYPSHSWTIPLFYSILCVLGYFATLFDVSKPTVRPGHIKEHRHHHHSHIHSSANHSRLTTFILKFCVPGSVMDTILRERDSRRIAYFGCLNLSFMLVQFFYGFVTGSLGLLTDSIHMLFDCLGLAVGLAAAVMSKWPPSMNFPYGYGKIDTLSGFANGIFLMLVSIEIVFDAIHRLHEGHELRRLNELLLISVLGFLVNIVGLTAFGHAHHGHSHGHFHSHSHETHSHEPQSHAHAHAHAHGHDHPHSHESHSHSHESRSHSHNINPGLQVETHGHRDHHEHNPKHDLHDNSASNGHSKPLGLGLQHSPDLSVPPTPFSMPPTPGLLTPKTPHAHSHDHGNENMQGIFLHIMADALGSVAVIISTLLTKYDGWSGWDPLASCAIAVLIFASALPLVRSSGMRLLLSVPNETEYVCRDTLQGISELRGVVGYAGVRFWVGDKSSDGHDEHDEHGQHITGAIHIIAIHGADLEDVRERSTQYLKGRGVDAVVQVEREGDTRCWCGGARS